MRGMTNDARDFDVELTWREGGSRRETSGEALGQLGGIDAARLFVDLTFPDAATRDLLREDKTLALFRVEREGEAFEVEAAWRVRGALLPG